MMMAVLWYEYGARERCVLCFALYGHTVSVQYMGWWYALRIYGLVFCMNQALAASLLLLHSPILYVYIVI